MSEGVYLSNKLQLKENSLQEMDAEIITLRRTLWHDINRLATPNRNQITELIEKNR